MKIALDEPTNATRGYVNIIEKVDLKAPDNDRSAWETLIENLPLTVTHCYTALQERIQVELVKRALEEDQENGKQILFQNL